MTDWRRLVPTVMLPLACFPAMAELQSVAVGGELRIRGNGYFDTGGALTPEAGSMRFVEQRTLLRVETEFTGAVSALVSLADYGRWGEDLRSEVLTGGDARAMTLDDIEVYEAYVEFEAPWVEGLTLRAGRQELIMGNEWLLGNNDSGYNFRGLTFDGLLVSYGTQRWAVWGAAAKLSEGGAVEEDGDVNLYALHGRYGVTEDIGVESVLDIRARRAGKRAGLSL